MPLDQVPTVFVALVLAPNQYELFEEIQAEAMDILADRPVAMRRHLSGARGAVFLDCDCGRIALRWSNRARGNVLTLAIGSRPDLLLTPNEARQAADILRQLVSRAEALFEVKRAVWQIAMLPLIACSLNTHLELLERSKFGASRHTDASFVTFEPDDSAERGSAKREPAKRGSSAGDFLNTIRAAMDGANAEPSWAMQASTLALSTAFVLVTPPVGISMFTYAALRQGSDMGLLPRELDLGLRAQPVPLPT